VKSGPPKKENRLRLFSAATAAASGTITGAGTAVGTANAFDAPFPGFPDISSSQSEDQCNNSNDDKIFHNL